MKRMISRINTWYGYKAPAATFDRKPIDPRYKRWPMVTDRS
jgi:hypothetical protein